MEILTEEHLKSDSKQKLNYPLNLLKETRDLLAETETKPVSIEVFHKEIKDTHLSYLC